MFRDNSYTLVLGGGGAKGSYQIGAWKALKELGFKFEAIIGTSVGALNGAIIAQDDYDTAVKMWKGLTIDSIINLPKELIKDGKINVNPMNIKYLKDFRKSVILNNGLDTAPLRNLLSKYVIEEKVRKTGIDFGVVTYEFNNLKPFEIFINEMNIGELESYLLASSSFPGFKLTSIKGRKFIDGGIHDNVPVSTAKERGYKRLIVIDVSGIGMNRKPDVFNTETVYIKNSSDTGGIFDFNVENVLKNIEMGYLDTMKIFGKYSGIDYFYNKDEKTIHRLELTLISDEFSKRCSKQFDANVFNLNGQSAFAAIKNILPANLKNYKNVIIPLIECAASSLKMEKNKNYDFNELIKELWEKYNSYKAASVPDENAIDIVLKKIKNPVNLFRISHIEYENILGTLLHSLKDFNLYSRIVLNIFPYFIPAKIAFILLDLHFKNER